jgi:hypothetical protein
MTAKQWAARAVVAATMAAGLSACGGGGDSAATSTTPTVTPELLTPGLTIKASSDGAFAKDTQYSAMTVAGILGVNDNAATEATVYADDGNNLELSATYLKATGQILKLVVIDTPTPNMLNWHAVGCGFGSLTCDNSRISINLTTKEIRITSLPLKTLTFTATSSPNVILDANTQLNANPGTVAVSGILTLP